MSMFFYFIREYLEYYIIIIHYHEEPIGQRQEIKRMNRKKYQNFCVSSFEMCVVRQPSCTIIIYDFTFVIWVPTLSRLRHRHGSHNRVCVFSLDKKTLYAHHETSHWRNDRMKNLCRF